MFTTTCLPPIIPVSLTGIPLLIVVVSFGATQGEGYGTESSCWLSVENKLIWAFVGPAFLVILVGALNNLGLKVRCLWQSGQWGLSIDILYTGTR